MVLNNNLALVELEWKSFLEISERFTAIAFNPSENLTVRIQNAFKAVEFALQAYAAKYGKNRLSRESELLFVELNFGFKAASDYRVLIDAYFNSYKRILSNDRARDALRRASLLLEKIHAVLRG
jgi:hypothetical protein